MLHLLRYICPPHDCIQTTYTLHIAPLHCNSNGTTQLCHHLFMWPKCHLLPAGGQDVVEQLLTLTSDSTHCFNSKWNKFSMLHLSCLSILIALPHLSLMRCCEWFPGSDHA